MRRRQGFTLVEMMVATALALFIMVILTQAFVAGLETFRQLKSIGDMEERMRMATTLLRRDLSNYWLQNTNGPRRRLSDSNFWPTQGVAPLPGQGPPDLGFFRIWQGGAATFEGQDPDGIDSTRATDQILHFTAKLPGLQGQDFATASVPQVWPDPPYPVTPAINLSPLLDPSDPSNPQQRYDSRYQTLFAGTSPPNPAGPNFGSFNQVSDYNTPWYQVAYFLRPNGASANGTPLFTLYRRQQAVVPFSQRVNSDQAISAYNADGLAKYAEMSCKLKNSLDCAPSPALYPPPGGIPPATPPDQYNLDFDDPASLTVPFRRFGMLPLSPSSPTVVVDPTATPPKSAVAEQAGLVNVPLLPTNFPGGALRSFAGSRYPVFGEPLSSGSLPAWSAPPFTAPPYTSSYSGVALLPPWQDNPALRGSDILLTDVLSFDVKVLLPESQARTTASPGLGLDSYVDLLDTVAVSKYPAGVSGVPLPALSSSSNAVFQYFKSVSGGPVVFDTWTSAVGDVNGGVHYDYSQWNYYPTANPPPNDPTYSTTSTERTVPLQVRILALKITLRIWDQKTQQSRQITLVQAM